MTRAAAAARRTQGLELAVPGTYLIGESVVTIAAFAPQLHVITSKQRPRKLTIHGSDGAEYMFLLKGHEDLRQVPSRLTAPPSSSAHLSIAVLPAQGERCCAAAAAAAGDTPGGQDPARQPP